MAVKLIAFDLDGTMLDSRKQLSAENAQALAHAAQAGIYTVPTTGRIVAGIPEHILTRLHARYIIACNGAAVFDMQSGDKLCSANLSYEQAEAVCRFAESSGGYYDCYLGDWGYLPSAFADELYDSIDDIYVREHMRRLRTPVDDFFGELKKRENEIVKVCAYYFDPNRRLEQIAAMREKFPELNVSSSIPFNIEVNTKQASKGRALDFLCSYLGIAREEVMAFGDGLNDIDMLKTAGISVAMANADASAKAAADIITKSNDENGCAYIIEEYLKEL